jgi:hypothetical protein
MMRRAIKSGHLGAVGLDVFEGEEGYFFEDHSPQVIQNDLLARLMTFPNVIVTGASSGGGGGQGLMGKDTKRSSPRRRSTRSRL